LLSVSSKGKLKGKNFNQCAGWKQRTGEMKCQEVSLSCLKN